jgi:hypothetical protein
LTFEIRLYYNEDAGWRGILLSPASFAFETLAPHQPVFFFIPLLRGTVCAKKEKRRNVQIQAVLLSRVLACYGAALSWLNAGDGVKAKELALKAAEHPSCKAKSGEILIKSAAGFRPG